MSNYPLLQASNITKSYKQGGKDLKILQNLELSVEAGEIVALVGPSGSGKSTLLQILGLLDTSSAGQLMYGRQDVSRLSDKGRTELRRGSIGFVYQFHHLLPEFSAAENAAMPLIIAGVKYDAAIAKAEKRLSAMGLGGRTGHRPAELSGGEQQRVAIARALIHDPHLLFADEPTGNLDPKTSDEVFDILLTQVRERSVGALIATHNIDLADRMDRVLELKNGRVTAY